MTRPSLEFPFQFHLIINPSYIQFYTFTIQLNTNIILKFITSKGYITTNKNKGTTLHDCI